MSTPRWHNYLSLPHKFGADPDDGEGCDCLLMVFNILDDLNLPHPPLNPRWLEMAQACQWNELQAIWNHLTTPLPLYPPEDGAVTLIRNGRAGLGVAIVLEEGLLMVHHRRGVVWVPLHLLRITHFYRFI